MKRMHLQSALLVGLVACAGDPATDEDPGTTMAVSAITPGDIPAGEAIVNLSWFPRAGVSGVARLVVDGVPAVWGENAAIVGFDPRPTAGSPVELAAQAGAPPVGLPLGSTVVELVVGETVVARETIELEASKLYALVAYGDLAAPLHRLFVDALPVADAGAGPVALRVLNVHPEGQELVAETVAGGARTTLFEHLAYGELWEGSAARGEMLQFTEQGAAPGSFGVVLERAARMYVGSPASLSGFQGPVSGDTWFAR